MLPGACGGDECARECTPKMSKARSLSRHRTPRIGKLDSLKGVRHELIRLYRAGRRGDLDTQHMTRLAFVLQAIAKVLASSEIEERLARLETLLAQGTAHNGNAPDNRSA